LSARYRAGNGMAPGSAYCGQFEKYKTNPRVMDSHYSFANEPTHRKDAKRCIVVVKEFLCVVCLFAV
jgi:hypothetical protein